MKIFFCAVTATLIICICNGQNQVKPNYENSRYILKANNEHSYTEKYVLQEADGSTFVRTVIGLKTPKFDTTKRYPPIVKITKEGSPEYPEKLDCRMTKLGREYEGDRDRAQYDKYECQRWDKQAPHKHTRNKLAKFPDASLADASNYCRNPDGVLEGPWCYTTNERVRWRYCQIPYCPGDGTSRNIDCQLSKLGSEYFGKVNKTKSGRICQRWNSQIPHQHTRTNAGAFPDASLADANNYCRNPDGEPYGPWCYTTDRNKRWEYCDVPQCV